jgi:molybdate transport system substrate-binding protein
MGDVLRMRRPTLALIAAAVASFFASRPVSAAEIRVWTARALGTVLEEIGPEFERSVGHKLVITVSISTEFAKRAEAGEQFDVFISLSPALDLWIKNERIVRDTFTEIARSGVGVEVRAGAAKPDIGSVDAFKRTLLEAKSIGYLTFGSGLHVAKVIDRLGVADAIKAKVTRPDTDIVSELVAKGEIELGMVIITQIMTTPGVQLVGPLPAELQDYVYFSAGVSSNSKVPSAAKDLIKFLTSPKAAPTIRGQEWSPRRSERDDRAGAALTPTVHTCPSFVGRCQSEPLIG